MRRAVLLAALLVPFSGCLHAIDPAGVAADDLAKHSGWTVKESKTDTRFAVAKVATRSYERADLTAGYAVLAVFTVTDVPILTSRAVGAVAENALAKADAKEADPITIDFRRAVSKSVDAKGFTVEKDGVAGRGFRAEFECADGYVAVVGFGANLPLGAAIGPSMFDDVVALAKDVTCDGG